MLGGWLTSGFHPCAQQLSAQMFTEQLAQVDGLSIKPNARFAWNIKWVIMRAERK